MNIKKIYLFLGLFIIGLAVGRPFFTSDRSSKTQLTTNRESINAPAPVQSIYKVDKIAGAVASIPIKKPNLRLEGTFMGKGSYIAYIRELDFDIGRFYSIGDKVANAKLIDIKSGEAVLDISGKRYSLYLESGYRGDSPIPRLSNTFRRLKRDMVLNMLNADDSVKNSVKINPAADNEGNFRGYVIDGIRPGSFASLLGLANGDIIKAVNGQKLLTQQNAIQTFRKVRKMGDIRLDVLRDKKDINIKYTLR